jgi:metal-dependent amidase/aminoacylase/carboxypeptidase family protein
MNTIPSHAVLLKGTARILSPQVRDTIEGRLRRIVKGIADSYRASVAVSYRTITRRW